MGTVHFKSMRELRKGLEAYGKAGEAAMLRAAKEASVFARTAVIREQYRMKPQPKATGEYWRSWVSGATKRGPYVANKARHAIFVEKGRRPGRMPPVEAIREWLYATGTLSRPSASYGSARQRSRARIRRRMHINIMALPIARAIGKRGIKARPVLGRAMPHIIKRYFRDVRKQMKELNKRPPKR